MSAHGGGAPDNRRRQSLPYALPRLTTNFQQSNGQQDVVTDTQLTYHPENLSGPHPQSEVNDARYSPQQNTLSTEVFDGMDGAGPTADPFHGHSSALFADYNPYPSIDESTDAESLDVPAESGWLDHIDSMSMSTSTSPYAQSSTLLSPPTDSYVGYSSGHSPAAMSTSFMDSPFPTSRGSSALGHDARRHSADLDSPASRRHMELLAHAYPSRFANIRLPGSAPPYVTAFPNPYNATTSNNERFAEASTSALPQTSPTGLYLYPPGFAPPSRYNSSSPWSGMPSSAGSSSHQYQLPELELGASRRHSAYGSSSPELPVARPTHQYSYSDGYTYATTSQQGVGAYTSSMPTTVPSQFPGWQGSPMDIGYALPQATHSQYLPEPTEAAQVLDPNLRPVGSESGSTIPFPPHYPDPTLRFPSHNFDAPPRLPSHYPEGTSRLPAHNPDPTFRESHMHKNSRKKHRKRGTYKTKVKSADGIVRSASEEYRYNVENGVFDVVTGNPDEQRSPPRPMRRKREVVKRRKGGEVVKACKACSDRHYRCDQAERGARCERCIADGLECVYDKKKEKEKGGSTKGK